jgi:RNA polymerase subunit RPABC4/transcription elongation factor Spt4
MIVCKTCGEQNENGTRFCANCSSFLEWDGEAVPTGPVPVHLLDRTQPGGQPAPAPAPGTLGTPPPPPPGAPTNDRPPTQPTTVINVPREMLNRPSRGMAGTNPGPTPPPPAPPAPPAGGYPPPPTAPSPMPPMGGPGYQPYPQQPQPYPQPAPAPNQGPQARMPGAQQPSEPVRRRRRAAPPSNAQPGVAPGEIACRVCGTGNPPDRKFCRTCGTATMMEDAPPPQRVGFWRRLFGGGGDRTMQAGTRHDRIRQPAHLIRPIVAIVIIIALLVIGFGPGRPYIIAGVDAFRDQISTKVVIQATGWTASSVHSAKETASMAGDAKGITYWAPASGKTNGVDQWLQANFTPPIGRLEQVSFAIGISQDPTVFLTAGRPVKVRITLTNTQGETFSQETDLTDTFGFSSHIKVRGTDVRSVTITILNFSQMAAGKVVAINEIQFQEDKSRHI